MTRTPDKMSIGTMSEPPAGSQGISLVPTQDVQPLAHIIRPMIDAVRTVFTPKVHHPQAALTLRAIIAKRLL